MELLITHRHLTSLLLLNVTFLFLDSVELRLTSHQVPSQHVGTVVSYDVLDVQLELLPLPRHLLLRWIDGVTVRR